MEQQPSDRYVVNLLLLIKGRKKEMKILLLRPLISTLLPRHSSTLGFEGNGGEKKKVKRVWRENGGRCSGVLAVHLLSTNLQ